MNNDASYTILKFKASELPSQYHAMLQSRFLRSLRNYNDYFSLIDRKVYFTIYRQYILTLVQRPGAVVRLAVLSDDHDVVVGWSLTEPDVLHYVHVLGPGRNQGIGSSLVPETFSWFSHLTRIGITIWSKKYQSAKFNPFY